MVRIFIILVTLVAYGQSFFAVPAPTSSPPPTCLRQSRSGCVGPYVIRPARKSSESDTSESKEPITSQSQDADLSELLNEGTDPLAPQMCRADHEATMTACLEKCQKDTCCQAFGVDSAGECVTSPIYTETLDFVKESPLPLPDQCIEVLCFLKSCKNAGTCRAAERDVVCDCPDQFVGERCETDRCVAFPCKNGATCEFVDGAQICHCISGFSGDKCENQGTHVLSGEPLTVTMQQPFDAGDWGSWDTCNPGSYAAGIQLEIEPDQGSGDDTAVNVIRLLCVQAWGDFPETSNITSAIMYWGQAGEKTRCPEDYWIVGYVLVYQIDQGLLDDMGVTGLRVECRGPGVRSGTVLMSLTHTGGYNMISLSLWSFWSMSCPPGTAVCALRTRVLPFQGGRLLLWDNAGDDATVTDAQMHCCKY